MEGQTHHVGRNFYVYLAPRRSLQECLLLSSVDSDRVDCDRLLSFANKEDSHSYQIAQDRDPKCDVPGRLPSRSGQRLGGVHRDRGLAQTQPLERRKAQYKQRRDPEDNIGDHDVLTAPQRNKGEGYFIVLQILPLLWANMSITFSKPVCG